MPQHMCTDSPKGAALVLPCKANSEPCAWLSLLTFLACLSLNIDFAPPLSSLIWDGNPTANSGIKCIYIYIHSLVFLLLFFFGEGGMSVDLFCVSLPTPGCEPSNLKLNT